ncbi:hypothetical protein PEC302107_36020 [Pectobacterium araliae]|uniref:DNA replication domain protein n=1 Tax=Pectobacterium araliae TaxID=3073862 RepID=UPI00208A9A6D|nr:hypothetical protein PEC302107_36020 [Pectobacterium carotovorum subsp. carotovorum]
MADWIKVEVSTSQKIEVFILSEILDLDADSVLGKLVKLWSWADANTVDGHAHSVTKKILDRVVGCDGFADAMLDTRVNWLKQTESGDLIFPNFDRHNGSGAKKRALAAQRKAIQRQKEEEEKMSRSQRDKNETREEKRREEKRREDINKDPPLTPPKPKKEFPYPDNLNVEAWDEWKQYRKDLKLKSYAPTSRSEGAAITNLINLSGGDKQRQEEIIKQSMANCWQGLFELKPNGVRAGDPPLDHWNDRESWEKNFI